MAKISKKLTSIKFKDGLTGSALVNNVAGYATGATTMLIDTVVLNTLDTDLVPVGARFTVVGETGLPKHTVTAVIGNPTTSITFTPAIGAGAIADNAVITFYSQELTVKIGDGNLTWTETKNNEYQLDRGILDTVLDGDDVPVSINLAFTWEFLETGTGETVTPHDAIKGIGGAAGWVRTSDDPCESYAVDLEAEYIPSCQTVSVEKEIILFPDFRYDTLVYDLDAASVTVTGQAMATQATLTRATI